MNRLPNGSEFPGSPQRTAELTDGVSFFDIVGTVHFAVRNFRKATHKVTEGQPLAEDQWKQGYPAPQDSSSADMGA